MNFPLIIPEATKETFIAPDQDYIRDILIAYLKTYFIEHPDTSYLRDYNAEVIRKLSISGAFKFDIRNMPQIAVNVNLTETKPLAIGDIAYASNDKIAVIHSQSLDAKLDIYSLSLNENQLLQSLSGYAFTNKWFRFMLYKFGIYIIDGSLRYGPVSSVSYLPDKVYYRSNINFKIWAQIEQEITRKTGKIIENFVPEPDKDP